MSFPRVGHMQGVERVIKFKVILLGWYDPNDGFLERTVMLFGSLL